MGWLGSALRTAGDVGSQIQGARENIANQKAQSQKDQLDQITANLKLQQIRQQMGLQTPEGIRGLLRGVLQREPTEQEVQQYLQIAPKATPAAKNPYADVRVGTDGKLYGVNIETGKLEPVASADASGAPNFPVPDQKPTPKDIPEVKSFNGFDWQYDPYGVLATQLSGQGKPVERYGPYVKLGKTQQSLKTGQEATPLDALITDIVAGRATLPAGKLGAQVAARAKEMGVTLPDVKTNTTTEADRALSLANTALRNFQQTSAKSHWYAPGTYGTTGPALQDLKDKAQDAADKLTAAGMPVPPWLKPYISFPANANVPTPPPGYKLDQPNAR